MADYAFPWNELIAAFKFRGRAELAVGLAPLMATAVSADWQDRGGERPAVVTAVPMSAPGLQTRGYNQAWELARRVAQVLQLPAEAELLQRPLHTAHQVDLGRAERQRNLRAAFMVNPLMRHRIKDQTVALVDDVMTTGATAQAAAEALLRSGAAAVDVWVLARTPEPDQEN